MTVRAGTGSARSFRCAVLVGAGLVFPGAGAAQDASELSGLVFDTVSLSAAVESPAELGESAAGGERALLGSVAEHVDALQRLRRSGAERPEIIERLAMLGVDYQGLGRHEEALETFDEAVALMVERGGEDNLEQIPLLEQKISSYLALDDVRSVDDTEERIYALREQSAIPGSRQMYIATINLADWNTTAYYRENYGDANRALRRQSGVIERAPRALADASGDNSLPIFNGTIKDVYVQDINDVRLRRIDRLYKDYRDAISERGDAQLDIMLDLSRRVARLAFATKQEMNYERDNPVYVPGYDGSREQAARNSPRRMAESYESGKEALEYAITVLRTVDGARDEALAAALLDLGDWHLAYGEVRGAKNAYLESYETLMDAGYLSENIDVALSAEVPVQVPVFAAHLYSRRSRGIGPNAELDYDGYIDLNYTVDDLGNARRVEFLGGSADDASGVERALEIHLRSAKFRPTLVGGELQSPGRVAVRYYYAY